jgi:hypothetical protein
MSFGRVHRNDALLEQEEQLRYFDMKAGKLIPMSLTNLPRGPYLVPFPPQPWQFYTRADRPPGRMFPTIYRTEHLILSKLAGPVHNDCFGAHRPHQGLSEALKSRGGRAPASPRTPDCVDAVPLKTSGCSNAANDVEQSDG